MLVSPASVQHSLASPMGLEPYWQEVSSMEGAPIATTEEDTLMEMSEVQVWPSGKSPCLVAVEDSSLECSNAEDSEGLSFGSVGRPGSATPCTGRGPIGLSGSVELLEDQSIGADSEHSAATPGTGVNINGLDGGQGLETDEKAVEVAVGAGRNVSERDIEGLGVKDDTGLVEGLSVIAGQQRVYARMCESPGLSRVADRNGDR